MAILLQQDGCKHSLISTNNTFIHIDDITINAKLLIPHAWASTCSTGQSSGLDLYSLTDIVIESKIYLTIAIDIIIDPNVEIYGQIALFFDCAQ